MKIIVNVTQKDIDGGTPSQTESCPIALALRRRVRGKIAVYPSTLCFTGRELFIDLPKKAQDFIVRFDSRRRLKSLKPFRFTLDIPKKVLKKPKHRGATQ